MYFYSGEQQVHLKNQNIIFHQLFKKLNIEYALTS